MLSKPNRIRKNKEFNFIYKKGKSFGCEYFSIHYVKTRLPVAKFGFSISKKVGNSVVRSRTKRLLSEVAKTCLDNIVINNYVITAKPLIVNLSLFDLQNEMVKLLKSNHLLIEDIK